jgi:hypothetical protein
MIVEHSKTFFCSLRFPRAHESISSKFIDNFGTCLKKMFAIPGLGSSVRGAYMIIW